MHPVPTQLHGRAFTRADAEALGVTRRMLQGQRFMRIHPGVFRTADTPADLKVLIQAARFVLPDDAAVSHLTNLRLRGLAVGPLLPLHFSTNRPHEVDRRDLIVHRRQALLHRQLVDGFPALGPYRTFVDAATRLNERNLLRVGDWLVHTGQVHLAELRAYVHDSHLNGVQRARRVAPHLSEGVESVRESDVRWALMREDLPAPEVNVDIHDDAGGWLARGDLVYRRWKVLVEYDGWHHERDATQRQWDHHRREALEAAGWRVIVVTSADMASLPTIAIRVRQALRQRGQLP
ncbi:MAG: DUF559 domain-containing protein [Aeromicrobium sp.]